jgi:hypothetical protein
MSGNRILITGATGFIGRPLSLELARAGYEVLCLTRHPENQAVIFQGCCEARKWDGQSSKGWGPLVEGASAVINLAGDNLAEGRWTKSKKRRILGSRLKAGAACVEAIKAAAIKPQVLVQASAIGFYGPRTDEELDENSPPGSGFLADVVRQWEESTREAEQYGVRRMIIRSGLVLGNAGGVFPKLLMPFRFFVGGPLGGGRQWFSWIHLDDEVRAIRFLLERSELSGVFNLTAPAPLTEKDFAKVLGRVLRRPSWMSVPAWLLILLFGDKARETLLAGQRVLPKRLLQSGFEFRHPAAAPALKALLTGEKQPPS